MTDFGGMGGVPDTVAFEKYKDDLFAQALNRQYGDAIRASEPGDWHNANSVAARAWGALANVDWVHANGDTASYSFRAAGDLLASIRGKGQYMDWYCSSEAGVPDEIEEGMAQEGWTPDEDNYQEVGL
jgi:hypothetical protein